MTSRVKMPSTVTTIQCPACGGDGEVLAFGRVRTCSECSGHGDVAACPECWGEGSYEVGDSETDRVEDEDCSNCDGTGVDPDRDDSGGF